MSHEAEVTHSYLCSTHNHVTQCGSHTRDVQSSLEETPNQLRAFTLAFTIFLSFAFMLCVRGWLGVLSHVHLADQLQVARPVIGLLVIVQRQLVGLALLVLED